MSDLKLNLIMSARERVTGPLSAVIKGSKSVGRQLGAQRKELQRLQRQQDDVSSFQAMERATNELGDEVSKAQQKVNRYQRALDRSDGSNRKVATGLKRAQRELTRANTKYDKGTAKLSKFRDRLNEAGLNTSDLASQQKRLTRAIEGHSDSVDKLRNRYRNLKQMQERVNKVREAGSRLMDKAQKYAVGGLAAAGAGSYFFKTQFLDTAAQFEEFEAILKTVEGSSSKARASMRWVSDFAAKTPYELAEVTESFVQLRAYGLDPTSGLLKTLGDTSAAMGKDVMQAVEAIADAVTGENERLKEFGIRASKGGGRITYEYTNKAGEQKTATVKDDDRKAIEQTLRTIWNEKFAGAMRERSRTWRGMISNMSDQWTRFTNMVMAQGTFDWMKNKLSGLLDKVDQMAADGTLERVAKDWGAKLTGFATGVWAAGEAVTGLITNFTDLVGGAENAVYILAGMSFAPLISSVVALGVALGPIGWTLAGISALVTGITLAFKNWDKISDWFAEKFGADDDFKGSGNARAAQRRKIKSNPAPVNGYIPVANSGGSTVVQQMTIQAAPGMDEAAVGREVAKALEEQNRRSQRARRSRMRDSD